MLEQQYDYCRKLAAPRHADQHADLRLGFDRIFGWRQVNRLCDKAMSRCDPIEEQRRRMRIARLSVLDHLLCDFEGIVGNELAECSSTFVLRSLWPALRIT
jgi:hypothetical protein